MKKILIVDDEIYARDHLGRFLEKQGYNIFVASSGEEGIEIYKEKRPDIVLLDVLLPGIDGDHVFKYIREFDPDASVYFITARNNVITEEEAVKMGAKGYLSKPVLLEDILSILKKEEND